MALAQREGLARCRIIDKQNDRETNFHLCLVAEKSSWSLQVALSAAHSIQASQPTLRRTGAGLEISDTMALVLSFSEAFERGFAVENRSFFAAENIQFCPRPIQRSILLCRVSQTRRLVPACHSGLFRPREMPQVLLLTRTCAKISHHPKTSVSLSVSPVGGNDSCNPEQSSKRPRNSLFAPPQQQQHSFGQPAKNAKRLQ